MGEAGACRACGNVVCHRCSCGFVCDPAGQFWEPFPNDHEISGNYADEQYPSEGKFLKRLDAFMIAIWFFTLFALVTVFLFYAQELVQKLRKKIRIKMVSLWGDGCRFRGGRNAPPKQPWGMVPGLSAVYRNPVVFVPAIVCTIVGKGEKRHEG